MKSHRKVFPVSFLIVLILSLWYSQSSALSSNWEEELIQQMIVCGGGPLIFDEQDRPIVTYPERSISGETGMLQLAYKRGGSWDTIDISEFPSSINYAGMPAPSLAMSPSGVWGVPIVKRI